MNATPENDVGVVPASDRASIPFRTLAILISDRSMRNRISEPESLLAVQSWENEGGHFPDLRSVATQPSDTSQSIGKVAAAPENLAAMRARFRFDFSHGLMGERHNTFQHRSRMLRQAEACAMTASAPHPYPRNQGVSDGQRSATRKQGSA